MRDDRNYLFIKISRHDDEGYWGSGSTQEDAVHQWQLAGGRKKHRMQSWKVFESKLPFAPLERDAEEHEADAYISDIGTLVYKRCEDVSKEASVKYSLKNI